MAKKKAKAYRGKFDLGEREVRDYRKKLMIEKVSTLFIDWLSTKSKNEIKEVKKTLKKAETDVTAFSQLLREMGTDGKTLMSIYQRDWTLVGNQPVVAKKKFVQELSKSIPKKLNKLNEDNGSVVTSIGQSYFPISDRSNQMQDIITPNDRDLVVQIRNAITGGNMSIAGELMKTGWGALSLKERNGIIEWVNGIGAYGEMTPDILKARKSTIKPMEKRSEMNKDEFAERVVMTAKENMKIQ